MFGHPPALGAEPPIACDLERTAEGAVHISKNTALSTNAEPGQAADRGLPNVLIPASE
jgi:hypothetical protein